MIGSKPREILVCVLLGFGGGLALRSLSPEAPPPPRPAAKARPIAAAPPAAEVDLSSLIAERDRLREEARVIEEKLAARREQEAKAEAEPAVEETAASEGLALRWQSLARTVDAAYAEVAAGRPLPDQREAEAAFMSFLADCLKDRKRALELAVARLDATSEGRGDIEVAATLAKMLMPKGEESLVLGRAMIRLLGRHRDAQAAQSLAFNLPLDSEDPPAELVDALLGVARGEEALPGRSQALAVLSRLESGRARARIFELVATPVTPAAVRLQALKTLDLTVLDEAEPRLLKLTEEPSLRDLAFARLAELPSSAAVRAEAEDALRKHRFQGDGGGLARALAVHGDARTRALLERIPQDSGSTTAQREVAAKALAAIEASDRP